MRKEFPRVTPESVGVPSAQVEWLLDRLEEITEPHGLMLMRHGRVFAEGWWAPYAPGLRHGLQSHSKTYAATGVGVAYTEGRLRLDEHIIDIFPDCAPKNPSENLKKLTVHNVLSMGCGMDEMPAPTKDWIREFLSIPVNHEPGTAFMYNSMGSTLLAAIVRRKTGEGLHDYLKPRLYDKIGINAENHHWFHLPDGTEMGGGGLFATTEDNLRLMKLYADGGVWEGERILAEDYVKLATSQQIGNASERAVNPMAEDNFVGYGYQIWMCRPKGVYRADGAMGQFTIVIPDRDMIIAITETALGSTGGYGPQKVLDMLWEFLDRLPAPGVEDLPENPAACAHVQRRLKSLSLPNPDCSVPSPLEKALEGRYFRVTEGEYRITGFASGLARRLGGAYEKPLVDGLSFHFENGRCRIDFSRAGETVPLWVGTDGRRRENLLPDEQPSICLCDGCWVGESDFRLSLRMVETCYHAQYLFRFDGDTLTISYEGGINEFTMFGPRPADVKAVY